MLESPELPVSNHRGLSIFVSTDPIESAEGFDSGVRHLSLMIGGNLEYTLARFNIYNPTVLRHESSNADVTIQDSLRFEFVCSTPAFNGEAQEQTYYYTMFYLQDKPHVVKYSGTVTRNSTGKDDIPINLKIAEYTKDLKEPIGGWKEINFFSSMLAKSDLDSMFLEYLGENLILVRQKLPILVIDMDTLKLTQISTESVYKSVSDCHLWKTNYSSFAKIHSIDYWYDFETVFQQLVEQKKLKRQSDTQVQGG